MVTLGVIGCGQWGPNFIRNFSQLPDVNVEYACDINLKRLEHIKQLYPQVRTLTDYRDVIDNKGIEAVVISTPAVTHYKISKESLIKGKHVLVEKPIAIKVEEAEELIGLSRKTKRVLMVGHTFEYNPAVIKMRQLIKEGTLGRIYYLHSKRTNLGPLRQDVSAMWDLAPHDISIFSFLLNKQPVEVVACGQSYLDKDREDVSFITLVYSGKIIANIHVSWLDPRKVREVTIVGSKKMVVFDDLNANEPIRLYDKRVMKKRYSKDYDTFEEFRMLIQEGGVTIPKIKTEEPLKIESGHFIECIRDNKRPISDGRDGLWVLKVINAIQASLKNKGKRVRVK